MASPMPFPFNLRENMFQEEQPHYRIPALLYIQKSHTILAFAEQRGGEKDESAKLIVMHRGTYNETTHAVQWEKVKTIVKAPLGDHRPMNPCPVYDEVTGNVVLVFIAVEGNISEQHQLDKKENKARLCQVTSADNGVSWSPVTDLTDTDTVPKAWATFAVGPGHGLQLNNEVKSLVIPAHAYWIHENSSPSPHPFCFVSDDHGKTWKRGNFLSEKKAGECQVVELRSQGKSVLYCNARSKERARVQAVSYNEGRDFPSDQQCKIQNLVEPPEGCHGSVIGFPRPAGVQSEEDTWVLYSHPIDRNERKDLGVYLNKEPLNPESWTEPTVIYKGYCAYSDLQYMGPGPDGSPLFSCLFESGTKSNYEKILFFMFTLKQVFPYDC
uniref:exo-alpha-sialidase n=1 Tax=Pelodiscus sinensis TaxID=13735 RepID=K7GDB1_PELSI|nr:sialidase-2 [Pelodiscus sinensis]XP_014429379.1 sialidase-2 [Pelodiscus sinensis]XP_014429380.1 sialidase-2 [Pelodiscus sinensis]XP_025040762.1 sialidase-2 [Pelodiscus sinensis]|eukprot:XP_006123733.1 sialidase-2 [Pelodiscus sinensis]